MGLTGSQWRFFGKAIVSTELSTAQQKGDKKLLPF